MTTSVPTADGTAFLLCDSESQDTNGKTNVIGVFDTIFVASVPAVHASMSAFFRLQLAPPFEGRRLQIAFTTPSGMRQTSPELPLGVGPTGIAQGSINLAGFLLPEEGVYKFDLLLGGDRVNSYVIRVEKMRDEADALH